MGRIMLLQDVVDKLLTSRDTLYVVGAEDIIPDNKPWDLYYKISGEEEEKSMLRLEKMEVMEFYTASAQLYKETGIKRYLMNDNRGDGHIPFLIVEMEKMPIGIRPKIVQEIAILNEERLARELRNWDEIKTRLTDDKAQLI